MANKYGIMQLSFQSTTIILKLVKKQPKQLTISQINHIIPEIKKFFNVTNHGIRLGFSLFLRFFTFFKYFQSHLVEEVAPFFSHFRSSRSVHAIVVLSVDPRSEKCGPGLIRNVGAAVFVVFDLQKGFDDVKTEKRLAEDKYLNNRDENKVMLLKFLI
jgi:hypothetical protein